MRTGLLYKIEKTNELLENIMFIADNDNGLVLTVHYSEMDCRVALGFIQSTSILIFNFSKEYLKAFGGDNELVLPLRKEKEICCNTQLILHEIFNTKLIGTLKNMFIESKAIDLLLCFMKCNTIQLNSCETCKFLKNPIDKEKILKAKDILLSNIQTPPTIPELASQVGINQCYLKKGFKDLFDTTIFSFVQEQRIIKAKLLLTTTQEPIANIAELLGFSNQSNFTNAFKNFTGILPSDLRKDLLPYSQV